MKHTQKLQAHIETHSIMLHVSIQADSLWFIYLRSSLGMDQTH